MLTGSERAAYEENGYHVARGLFSFAEAAGLREHYMAMNASGDPRSHETVPDPASPDPLRRFPRILQPHRWDETSLRFLLDPRLNLILTELMGSEPLAVQTMHYFKPPGARGQALHQDQHFLRVQPGTCMAAWMALDPCDEENGCLNVVPGSHKLPLLCLTPANQEASFTDITVPIPPEAEVVPVAMLPGDVLFFDGQCIHGSLPNRSPTRFRRALIGHYIAGDARRVAHFYHPTLRMNGEEVAMEESTMGGSCGEFNEAREIEMRQFESATLTRHA